MKIFTKIFLAGALLAAGALSPMYADQLPYNGYTGFRGSYWNGPEYDYGNGPANLGYQAPNTRNAYARERCRRMVRTENILHRACS